MTVVICCAQIAPVWEDLGASIEKAATAITSAAAGGASLIVFPEQFPIGWDPRAGSGVENFDGPTLSALGNLARHHSIALVGSVRLGHDPLPLNTAVVIGPDGDIRTHYSKIHLFSPAGEHERFAPGDALASFTLDGMTFALTICYDLRFPDLFALYSHLGVDCMLVPAAWPCRRKEQWELLIRARAVDYQTYVAGINTVGTTPVDHYCGRTVVAEPGGAVIARAGEDETLLFATLDEDVIRSTRAQIPIHSDRREELYKRILKNL